MKRGRREFVRLIGGREVEIVLDEALLEIDAAKDFGVERSMVAADIGTVGGLLADVTEELELVDAEYRHWRGQTGTALLEKDAKQAEWKVKAELEGSPAFLEHKRAAAKLEGDQTYLQWFLTALKIKAEKLEAMRWDDRKVASAGRSARSERADDTADDTAAETADERRKRERRKQLAEIMNKK